MPRSTSNRRKSSARPGQRGATVSQLRHDIDRGRTNDKVNFPDPAAAPLGTDEEAAGTRLSPDLITQEQRREMDRTAPFRSSAEAAGPFATRRAVIAAVIVLIAIGVVLGLLLGR